MHLPAPLAVASAAVIALALAGCATPEEGADATVAVSTTLASDAPTTVATTDSVLDAISAVAELGYPRDLLDKGRVNVVLRRDDATDLVLLDKQLRIDGFDPAPVEERRTVVPTGRDVAVQAAFGEVVDCESPGPPAAALGVHYLLGDDATVHDGAIALDDTATLEDIRARFCTERQVLAENDLDFGDPAIEGETFTVDLTLRRRTGDAELTLHTLKGTVLFGFETTSEQGSPERVRPSDVDDLVIPLVVDVNRCDPHAVAETTRKSGLTLWISLDGADPQPVDVDISSILDEMETVLDRCRERTAG